MRSLTIDGNNDIYIGTDGDLAIVSDLDAILQNCRTAMQAQRGEMQYDTTRGMPNRDTVYDRYLPAQFVAAGRATLAAIDGVVSVDAFNVTRVDDILAYSATIKTIYGTGVING